MQPPATRVRELFDQAVDLPADQRATFLEQACGDDADLRQAVGDLLAAHEQAGTFLADPTIRPLALGARLGAYTIVKELGEGGFSTVYLAQQDPPLARRVALKLIKPGMDTRQVI